MNEIRSWTIRDAAETYNVNAWGAGYFRINPAGHIQVTPDGNGGPAVDLYELVQDLQARGLCHELSVGLLSEAAVADYLAARLPGGGPPPGLTGLLHQRTEGHPLFLVSLVTGGVRRPIA